jgi:hypothetical protein
VPIGKTFTGVSHNVTDGIFTCKNTGWTTTHSGRVYTLAFHHGSASTFSQCDIGRVSLHYKWTATVAKKQWATVTGNWVA